MREPKGSFFNGGKIMEKINWINGQSGGTPISAENLNLMQDNAENAINEVATNLEQLKTDVENKHTYATEEKKIGTWIDGKSIYRKVISLTASTSTKSLSISSIISNVEDIWINCSKSFYKIASGGSGIISDWEVSGGRFKAVIDVGTLYYVCSSSAYSKAEITLEYTKTTD